MGKRFRKIQTNPYRIDVFFEEKMEKSQKMELL